MSQALATPPPATAARRLIERIWTDPENRSTTIALVAVLLIHLFFFILAPRSIDLRPTALARPKSTARQFNIVISPESFAKQKQPPPPQQFVETNPDAPENTPDHTNNFGAQNQQVAQEKPTPNGTSERPAMEGKKDFQSNQIVSGQLQKLEDRLPPPEPMVAPQQQVANSAPRAEQIPLPGFEKLEGENKAGIGTNIAAAAQNARPVPNKVEGQRDVPLVEGATGIQQPAIDPRRPRPRPQIVKQQQVRPAILAENKFGTSNVGVVAINAKFNTYGAYLQRLVEAIQLSWDALLTETKAYPPQGTWVAVKFVIDSNGKIPRVVDVENHSSDFGSRACVQAITNRAPYGEWTEDMKAVLGDEQELVFTFYYE